MQNQKRRGKYDKLLPFTKSCGHWTNIYTICPSVSKVYLNISNTKRGIDYTVFFSLDKFAEVSKYIWRFHGSIVRGVGSNDRNLTLLQVVAGVKREDKLRVTRKSADLTNYTNDNLICKSFSDFEQIKIKLPKPIGKRENTTKLRSDTPLADAIFNRVFGPPPQRAISTEEVAEMMEKMENIDLDNFPMTFFQKETYLLEVASNKVEFNNKEDLKKHLQEIKRLGLGAVTATVSKKINRIVCKEESVDKILEEKIDGI